MEHAGTYTIKFSTAIIIIILTSGLAIAGIAGALFEYQQANNLRNEVSNLRVEVSQLQGFQNVTIQNITIYQNSTSLTEIYEKVSQSVVLIYGTTSTGTVQGSGFVYNYSGTCYVVTNNHVIHGTISRSVTFSDGNGYAANIVGSDPYADLAVLSVQNAPQSEFKPLQIVSSSILRVGDYVIAVGNPYGLVGSMTTGVISALGRTISEEYTSGFSIANIIQTSTPINPGNSGGPLLNYMGEVIGITTAIVTDSQGLGFAVPSNTIIREINALTTSPYTYEGHSYLGLNGTDMNYDMAQQLGITDVTYGWRVVYAKPDGPSNGLLQEDDVIVAMNGTRIKNHDDLASYLEEHTIPGNVVELTVYRKESGTWNQKLIDVTLAARPKI
jgi:S1-C subfamily serine protease